MPPCKLLLTYYVDACLNGICRVALKAISWASGVELNYTRTGNVFITFTTVFLNFCHVFTFFLTFFYLNVFYTYDLNEW